MDDMLDVYYGALSDEEPESGRCSPELFALDLYADSYAYYETEEEYEGQLTLEDVETENVSGRRID